jgi:hypothetical protein
MNTIGIDNVVEVEYRGTSGQLTSIHVVFSNGGHVGSFFGPGLLLALDLLKNQFPPKTDADRDLIRHPFPSPSRARLDINPDTLELFLKPSSLDDVSYVQLQTVFEELHHFNFFESRGRAFGTDRLLGELEKAFLRKKPVQQH